MVSAGAPVGPFPPGIEPDQYDRLRRRILRMMPSGLYLLGSRAGDRRNLMTLNWATQVSFEPKLLAVSVEREAVTHQLVDEGEVFALSLVGRDDKAVVRRFVKPAEASPDGSELNGHAVITATTGAPILAAAVAWLDCRVTSRVPCGGHTLFIGEVVDAGPRVAPSGGETASPEPSEVLRMEDTRMSYSG